MSRKKIIYYAGCTANFMEPDIARQTLFVLKQNGFDPVVPAQKCCGTPLISLGDKRSFLKNAEYNLKSFADMGCDIVTACTSCALALKHDYPDFLNSSQAESIAKRTFDIIEYLAILNKKGELKKPKKNISYKAAYHAPCHLKVLGEELVKERLNLIDQITKVDLAYLESGCCGMGGTFGMKKENYKISMEIGEPVFDEINQGSFETTLTDCPTCKLQLEQGTNAKVLHPIQVISQAY